MVTCKGNNPVKTNDPTPLTLDIHQGQHQHMFAQVADMVPTTVPRPVIWCSRI